MLRKLITFLVVVTLIATAGVALAACDLRTHVPCFSDRGRETCCPKSVGCCNGKCCDQRPAPPMPGPRPTPIPTPTPPKPDPPPYTGWATLIMQNDSGRPLSLFVDNQGPACPGTVPMCPTQVRVGFHTFSAKYADGRVFSSSSHHFQPGESFTWEVPFTGPPEPIFRPPEEVFETAEITVENLLDEDLYFSVDNKSLGVIRAGKEKKFTIKAGSRLLKVTNKQGKKREKVFDFEVGDDEVWTIAPRR